MSKTREQIEKQLDENIPQDVISQRDGGRGKLSFLEGWYVIDRLNSIFGADAWSYDVTDLNCVHQGVIPTRSGDVHSASYTCTVALYAQFPGSEAAKRITDVGFGNGTDKTDPGKPHELATKEAVTDAIKRCAKSLGKSLGLALYDKSGEFIDKPEKAAPVAPKKEEPVVAPTRKDINKSITDTAKVCIAKELYTRDSFQAMRKEKYGVETTEALTDSQANELLTILKKEAQDGKRLLA